MTEKKLWAEPELIVLVRNKPEEAVLTACKANLSGSGADANAGACGSAGQFCVAGCNDLPDS